MCRTDNAWLRCYHIICMHLLVSLFYSLALEMTERRKKASAMHCAASSGRCRSPPPVMQWMTEHDSNTPASNSCFSAAGLKSRNLRSNLFFFFLPFFLSAPLTSSSSACSLVCLCHHLFISGVRDLDSAPLGWLVVSRRQGARQLCVTQRACLCVCVRSRGQHKVSTPSLWACACDCPADTRM